MTFRVRPATNEDFASIYEMAKLTGGGFTNLPPDKGTLVEKLIRSERGFTTERTERGDDLFMFVLENVETGQIRGTCQVFSHVGVECPFYSYRISTLTQSSHALGRSFKAEMLNLVTDFDGCSEVGGLFLHPGERAGGLGLLLARSRYMFMRLHRHLFSDRTVAELRGVIDQAGASPFWDAVAGRFFGMSFQEADQFNATHGTQFIADLMPKTPIYTALLPQSALAVMGIPHPSGRAAMRMLEKEGFAFDCYIDIFDGGPTMAVCTDRIRTVSTSREVVLTDVSDAEGGQQMLVAAGHLTSFAACHGRVNLAPDDGATLDSDSAVALGIKPGDSFILAPR